MSSGPKNVSSSNQSQSSWTPNAGANPMYGWMAGLGQNLMQQPVPYFPGQTYVSPSQLTQQGIDALQQGVDQMTPTLGTAQGNYNFLSNAADVQNNPYVQGMMSQNAQAATDWLNKTALPGISNKAQQVNAMGSSRQGIAQGTAAAQAQKNLLAQNAQTQMQAYSQGLGAQQSALGQTGNMLQNYLQPANALMQGGQTVEGYQNAALQDQINRFNYTFQEPWMRAQNTQGILGAMQPLGTTYNSGQGTQPNPNYKSPLQTAVGVAGMVAPFFSDRRLKRNVKRVGKTPAGYNIYSFDYVWGEPGVGVMADEVPASWVVRHPSGYDMVDYSKVK